MGQAGRINMEKIKCEKCGKVMHGYGKNHVEYMLKQHMFTHEVKDKDGK